MHVLHHDVELGVGERPRLLQDRVGHGELADVVQETADREVAETLGREPELVADLCRAKRDPARVLLGVRVLLGELDEERADVRSEKGLGLGDEVRAAEISEQGARARDSAPQVVGDGEAHGRDPDDLEDVTEPPAEVPEGEEKSCREGNCEPRDADGNEEIRTTLCEPIRAQRTPEERGIEREPGAQHDPGRGAPRLRNRRHQPGLGDRREPEAEDEDDARREQPEQRLDGSGPPNRRERTEREDRSADRKRRAAREGRHADPVDEHARRREPMEAEQRRHDGEGTTHENGIAVPLARTRDRQRYCAGSRDPCTDRDPGEVDPAVDEDLVATDEVEKRCRHDRRERSRSEERNASRH